MSLSFQIKLEQSTLWLGWFVYQPYAELYRRKWLSLGLISKKIFSLKKKKRNRKTSYELSHTALVAQNLIELAVGFVEPD